MSLIGRTPITIPQNTEVTVEDGRVRVKGPKGELTRRLHPHVEISVGESEVTVSPKGGTRTIRALWGTFASHIANMVAGVNEPFVKRLVVEGVGYRVEQSDGSLVLNVGFSHPVSVSIPDGVDVSVEKNVVTVSGIDKERVGQFAANVRAVKKPEPYKGKGIRYENEVVRRKEGKKSA